MESTSPIIGLIFWATILLFSFIFPIMCLVNILKHEFKNNDKLIWTLVVILIPLIGSFLYFFIGKKARINVE
jgi:hypothetical protein